MDQKILAGFFTLGQEHFDYVEETLQLYDIGNYLIGFEVTPDAKKKEHFHVVFEGTDQIWNNFSKKVVEDHSLRSTGRGNKKYGKITKGIRDLERLCSYTLKEGNFRGTFPEEQIQEWYNKSFSKNEKVETREKILEQLGKHSFQQINALRLRAIQLQADIGANNRPTRSGIDGLVLEHFSRTGQHKKVFSMLYPMEEPPQLHPYHYNKKELLEEINQDVRDFLDPNDVPPILDI